MKIQGYGLTEHPLAQHGHGIEVIKAHLGGDQYLASIAPDFGTVESEDESEQEFAPGDYIVTDDPPTHAWAVEHNSFEATFTIPEQ